jgi:hypothetical protein
LYGKNKISIESIHGKKQAPRTTIMKATVLLPALVSWCSAAAVSRIPTAYESAVLGRRILALTPLGTLATVFPSDRTAPADDDVSEGETRPAGLGGVPLGLMDYMADCEGEGNPTLLALNIETHFRNVRAGSNISLAVRWAPPHPPSKRIAAADGSWLDRLLHWFRPGDDDDDDDTADPVPYSAANLPRFSLLGYVESIPDSDDRSDPDSPGAALAQCFLAAHRDAKYWLPGNRIHESHFVRLVVTHVYWIGGFGDRAYIGWIPVDKWKAVTREEWEKVRLPGEKDGWEEWSSQQDMLDL